VSRDPSHDARASGKSLITFIVTIIAAASSSVVSDHATKLLSTLNKDAAVYGDKQNLFISTDRFPEV